MSMKEVGQVSIKKGLYWTILKKDWDFILNVEKNDVNHFFDNFLLNMNEMLDKHTPI